MTAACDLLAVELVLDRIEAEVAAELPAHMRAFAAAHARTEAVPPAPAVLHRASTVSAALNALAHPVLADRGLALARLVVPIALGDDRGVVAARAATSTLDGDRGVVAARAAPTWDALAALMAARDAAARERFGAGFVETMHRFDGVTIAAREAAMPPALHAWHAPDGARSSIHDMWSTLAEQHGVRGVVEMRHAAVRPRTFVIEPGKHAIVVVPEVVTSPAARFAVLHEFGHALVALIAPAGVPRVLDEAAAAYIARAIEDAAHPWHSPLGVAARERRLQLATALDAIERGLSTARPTEKPPWALWHDPAAQASYVEAEAIADRWSTAPAPLAELIAAERARIDSSTK